MRMVYHNDKDVKSLRRCSMNYRASLAALFSGRQKEDLTQSTATIVTG